MSTHDTYLSVDDCTEKMNLLFQECAALSRLASPTVRQVERLASMNEEFSRLRTRRDELRTITAAVSPGGARGTIVHRGDLPQDRSTVSHTDTGPYRGYGYTGDALRGEALDVLARTERDQPHLRRAALDAIARSVEATDGGDVMAQYVRVAADLDYLTGFHKLLRNPALGQHEWTDDERRAFARTQQLQRAMALTDAAGGYMVPFALDPAVMLSSPGTSNRNLRSAFTVRTIATDVWNGVTSAGVTASWDAEAAEVSDDSPALAPVAIPVHKGQAFVPFSFEVGGDAALFSQEMSRLLVDAKERLEAAAFITGTGAGQPTGLITAAVAAGKTVPSTEADSLAGIDLYALKAALPARWRAQASWLANETIYDVIRQIADGAGPTSAFWADLGADTPPQLLGHPVYESSEMDATLTPSATNYVTVYGDLSAYTVVDRVGTTIELVPHLFGANGRPTGQRGFLLWFRTGGGLTVPDAVRLLNA